MSLTLKNGLTLTVEIALSSSTAGFGIWNVGFWDAARWGPDEVWTDVSAWVRSVETSREFNKGVQGWQAGSFTVVLSNLDGRFSEDNTTGPYAIGGINLLIPGRPIRIALTYAGVSHPIFRGYIDTWEQEWETYEGPNTGDAWVTITGSDEWGRFAGVPGFAVTPVGASETYGPRVNRLLDVLGFRGTRDLDLGAVPLQATDLSSDPLQELEATIASEGGSAYIDADGTFVARDRYGLVEDTRSVVVQATFGDGGGSEIPWESIGVAPTSTANVINYASYAAVGGTTQVTFDPASIALYGTLSNRATSTDRLMCANDSDVLTLAQWDVAFNKDPTSRFTEITIKPYCDPTRLIPIVLAMKVRDLIEVIKRPPSTTGFQMLRYCFISGVHVSIGNGDLTVTFGLASATQYRAFAASRFDVGLWGGSDADAAGARWFV